MGICTPKITRVRMKLQLSGTICILYIRTSQTDFRLKEQLCLTRQQTLCSRLKITIPHIPFSSLAWHFRLISYTDRLVNARSFKIFVDLSCPKSSLNDIHIKYTYIEYVYHLCRYLCDMDTYRPTKGALMIKLCKLVY